MNLLANGYFVIQIYFYLCFYFLVSYELKIRRPFELDGYNKNHSSEISSSRQFLHNNHRKKNCSNQS